MDEAAAAPTAGGDGDGEDGAGDRVAAVVRQAVDAFNAGRLPGEPRLDWTETTPLYGPDASLDSLSLVAFVVDVEHRLHQAFGLAGALSSDAAYAVTASPFRTLGSLVAFARQALQP